MKLFGKSLGEYVRFGAGLYTLIVVVAVLRFGFFQAGATVAQVKWLSLTVLAVAGAPYFGVMAHTRGFGGYKQLLGLLIVQQTIANGLVVLAIALGMLTHETNIYTRPEFAGPTTRPIVHLIGHIVGGIGVFSLVLWGPAALTMMITRRFTRTTALPPAAEPPAATPAPPSEPSAGLPPLEAPPTIQ
jgi:hypothetical protein